MKYLKLYLLVLEFCPVKPEIARFLITFRLHVLQESYAIYYHQNMNVSGTSQRTTMNKVSQ